MRIQRSALFKSHFLDMVANYRDRAGSEVALRFVDQVEDCVTFISHRPKACVVHTQLQGKTFRKWRLKSFPVSIFFRHELDDLIILDAIYAHRMNIAGRFSEDLDQSE